MEIQLTPCFAALTFANQLFNFFKKRSALFASKQIFPSTVDFFWRTFTKN